MCNLFWERNFAVGTYITRKVVHIAYKKLLLRYFLILCSCNSWLNVCPLKKPQPVRKSKQKKKTWKPLLHHHVFGQSSYSEGFISDKVPILTTSYCWALPLPFSQGDTDIALHCLSHFASNFEEISRILALWDRKTQKSNHYDKQATSRAKNGEGKNTLWKTVLFKMPQLWCSSFLSYFKNVQ